jgi:hypothetical protein
MNVGSDFSAAAFERRARFEDLSGGAARKTL